MLFILITNKDLYDRRQMIEYYGIMLLCYDFAIIDILVVL